MYTKRWMMLGLLCFSLLASPAVAQVDHNLQATIPRFPVDPISVDQLRALKKHSARDCTFDYVTKNAQFYLGPVNQLLPCVIVGVDQYWRDAQGGGREKVNRYHFRMAGMTERLDRLGMVEKVYMNDAAEDALLQIAYVAREGQPITETVQRWLAVDKHTLSATELREMDDPSRSFFADNPSDYHVVIVEFEVQK